MEKEKFINEILNSTNGITNITPNDFLLLRIQNKINNQNKVATKWVWMAAASIVFLVSLNSILLFSSFNKKTNDTELLVNTISNDNQLYN